MHCIGLVGVGALEVLPGRKEKLLLLSNTVKSMGFDGGIESKTVRLARLVLLSPFSYGERYSVIGLDPMMSTSDVSGFLGEKDDDEKASEFAPTLSYGRITLNDVVPLSLRS